MTRSQAEQLQSRLRGKLIQPSDDSYDETRAVYNGMIDKKPAAIARCANVADVIAAVNFARENKLEIAIRGGGHSGPGLCSCDKGLVIDLREMNSVRIDPEKRTARVGGGATWGNVDHAAHAFGLASVNGVVSTTGVAGLTLGGGHGYLSRKYGLAADNLLEADVVLADGSFVTASETRHEDLFWALRGGGGNFGVVTSFLFKLHPVDTVVAGPTFWPLDQAEEVLKWYRGFITKASDDLYGWFGLTKVPPLPIFPEELHLKLVAAIMWCYTGPQDKAEEVFAPIKKIGKPLLHGVQPMPYYILNTAFDELLPSGTHFYWKGDFFKELPDEAIKLHLKHVSKLPVDLATMHLYPVNGAVHRIAENETAFSSRDANWSMMIGGFSADGSHDEEMTRWAKEYWEALHPFSAGGAYQNFMMEEASDLVKVTHRNNYARLQKIKTKYDPDNIFHVNQNIKPTNGN